MGLLGGIEGILDSEFNMYFGFCFIFCWLFFGESKMVFRDFDNDLMIKYIVGVLLVFFFF